MEYTQNYALRKPGLNEYANVGDLNYNSDKIDSQMKKNQDVDGEVYDPTSTSANAYEAGDYVINPDDGLMYVCNGTTYGTWDATKWDHTTEFEEIQKAMASGGESELADLHDVDITNPTEGQVLTYDEQNDEWVNSDLPDADVTKEASGNPIELTDAASAPLVKCVTQITGSQDLHGQDKPWVGGAGKNKLDTILSDIKALNTTGTWTGNNYSLNGIVFSILTDNANNVIGIKATGTASANSTLVICNNPGLIEETNYIMTGCPAGGSDSKYRLSYSNNVDSAYADYGNSVQITEFSHSYQFRTIRITIFNGYSIPTDGIVFYTMIRLATVTDPTFAPYSNICPITAYTEGEIEVSDGDGNVTTHTTTYPSAIYRGSEDVVNGTVECERKKITISSGIVLYGNYGSENAPLFYWDSSVTDIAPYAHTEFPLNNRPISNFYNAVSTPSDDMLDCEFRTRYETDTIPTYRFYFRDSRFTTAADFNAYIANNPIEIAYRVIPSTTSTVTPTNLPVKSLNGYTHIESSTGEMEVEYIAKAFSPIMEIVDSQISALSKMMELMLTSARETTMIASANYTTGTLIVACGALYKATTAISSGASLVVGTNITPTTIAEELAALA